MTRTLFLFRGNCFPCQPQRYFSLSLHNPSCIIKFANHGMVWLDKGRVVCSAHRQPVFHARGEQQGQESIRERIQQSIFLIESSDWSRYVDTDLYDNRAGIRQGRGLAGGDPGRDEGDAAGDFRGGASSGRKLLSSGRGVGGRVLFFRPARRPEAFRRRRPPALGAWRTVQSPRRNERGDGAVPTARRPSIR